MTTPTRHRVKLLAMALCGSVQIASVSADEGSGPPWDPSYKIKPHESDRLTAADVVGPDGLQRIALEVDGKLVSERKRSAHWGGTYLLRATGSTVLRAARSGRHKLTGIAEWQDGRRREMTINVNVDPKHRLADGRQRYPNEPKGNAAILFAGDQRSGKSWRLAEDGRRGDQQIVLQQAAALQAGAAIVLEAPATERWNRLVRNACQWGSYRRYEFLVEKVDGRIIHLNQPLRIDLPVVDGSFAKQVFPIRRCGVEDLCLEQTQKLWTTGVLFANAWECWARGVKVIKAGRHPVYSRSAKWCEIRDCQFDGAWYVGGGGSAYVGWERSYDCLMDNVTTWRMRHAPCVQWSSSGNVIRNSTFHGSDAQWHAGWTNENLYENCTVYAAGSHGTYSHGGWASPPEDKAHGPEGPRNVIYNCDFRAPKSGLWMGGMNENWLILHNRFIVDKGPGIYARTCSFDHIIRGNVFVLHRTGQPAVMLATDDCSGVELTENRVFGEGATLLAGKAKPLVESDNNVVSDNGGVPSESESPRPKPKTPSIFLWQRELR